MTDFQVISVEDRLFLGYTGGDGRTLVGATEGGWIFVQHLFCNCGGWKKAVGELVTLPLINVTPYAFQL